MNRRQFVSSGAATALALRTTPVPAETVPHSPTPVLMKLGDQTSPTNDVHLKYLARYGVRNICGYPQIEGDRLYATVDELKRMTEMAARYDISIDFAGFGERFGGRRLCQVPIVIERVAAAGDAPGSEHAQDAHVVFD